MQRQLVRSFLAAITLLAATMTAWAHEGHSHHLMGTVNAVDASRLDLKTTDGKITSVAITRGTKVFKGKAVAKVGDIKKGARVMVETDRVSDHFKAMTIHLGTDAR